ADYFIPDLIPKSTVEYRNEEVDICDAQIFSQDGRRVNALLFGEEYTYSVKYISKTQKEFRKVSFGMEIKNAQGLNVGSVESVHSYKQNFFKESLGSGDVVELLFDFVCRYPSGLYFINS